MADRQLTSVLIRLRQAEHPPGGPVVLDGELLDRFIARRDEDAFEALVHRHGPMVLGVCRRILRHDEDAEDAFQATFLVLVRKAASVRPRGMVGNWLYGVAHNTAHKAKAMNTRRRRKEAQAVPRSTRPVDTCEELQARLDQELPALPDKYRAPVVLCDLEGKTLREAAGQLGWPQGTVATRLARGRTLLARRLARGGLSHSAGAIAIALAHGSAPARVPTSLVVSTVRVATSAAGLVQAPVAALTEGVITAMLLKKLKTLTAMLLAAALLGGGGILLASRTQGEERRPGKDVDKPLKDEKKAQEEKAKPDKEVLQGTWVGTSGERDGEAVPDDRLWTLVFDGDKVTLRIKERGRENEGTYSLDPDKKPKEIDLTFGSKVLNGIYELKGNTLKTLWRENDRPGLPAEFDSKKGVLMVFELKK
jgi:RNA polymerase sigma factor (sigma-70 family)